MSYITPRIDLAFKKIFGVEENKDLLISLINSVVSNEDKVADVELLNPYNYKNFKDDKLSILDIKAKGVDGKRFNIEIQITDEANYDKRALYYWGKLYTEQLKESGQYTDLNKAIGIHFLNFLSIPKANKYHNVFYISEKDTGQRFFTDLELHTIELTKFIDNLEEELVAPLTKLKNSLDMWAAFLTRHDLLQPDALPKNLDTINLKKAISVLDVINFNKYEREIYDDRLKFFMIETDALQKIKAEGIELGREQGIELGRTQGIEIGRAEAVIDTQICIAKKLLLNGMTLEQVAMTTGLSSFHLLKNIETVE